MKSIKEKSNEYAREYLFNPAPQKAPNEHFEAGANYVLEEIENILQNKNTGLVEMWDELMTLVEQLKK